MCVAHSLWQSENCLMPVYELCFLKVQVWCLHVIVIIDVAELKWFQKDQGNGSALRHGNQTPLSWPVCHNLNSAGLDAAADLLRLHFRERERELDWICQTHKHRLVLVIASPAPLWTVFLFQTMILTKTVSVIFAAAYSCLKLSILTFIAHLYSFVIIVRDCVLFGEINIGPGRQPQNRRSSSYEQIILW